MNLTNTLEIGKQSKRIRSIASVIMIVLMTATAEVLHEKEIIFPEIAALVIGAWFVDCQPWKVNRIKLVVLMTLSAIVGISIVGFVPLPMFWQVVIGIAFTAVSLTVSKTTLVPMISACILPIYLGTTTIIYPLSVFIMALIIVLVQRFFVDHNYLESVSYQPIVMSITEGLLYYGKRIFVFLILAYWPISVGKVYLVAPPLIVTFIEFTNVKSKLRKQYYKIIGLVGIAAIIGSTSRIYLYETLGLSLTVCTLIIVVSLLLIFSVFDIAFPPAGAIGMLPLILKSEGLLYYPILVVVGCYVLIVAAMTCFRDKSFE
jgi:hypothetical protein